MMLVVGAWLGMGDTCHDLSHVSSLMQTCLGLVEKHGRDQAKGKEFILLQGISSRERREIEKRKKKEEKENHKEKGWRKLFLHCFQIWADQELVLHTSRCEGFFLPGYFLVWGHGNGIWLSWFVIT